MLNSVIIVRVPILWTLSKMFYVIYSEDLEYISVSIRLLLRTKQQM